MWEGGRAQRTRQFLGSGVDGVARMEVKIGSDVGTKPGARWREH